MYLDFLKPERFMYTDMLLCHIEATEDYYRAIGSSYIANESFTEKLKNMSRVVKDFILKILIN